MHRLRDLPRLAPRGVMRVDGEFTGSDTHRLRQLLPFQNLFYIRQLLDRVGVGFNDALGILQRPPR